MIASGQVQEDFNGETIRRVVALLGVHAAATCDAATKYAVCPGNKSQGDLATTAALTEKTPYVQCLMGRLSDTNGFCLLFCPCRRSGIFGQCRRFSNFSRKLAGRNCVYPDAHSLFDATHGTATPFKRRMQQEVQRKRRMEEVSGGSRRFDQ